MDLLELVGVFVLAIGVPFVAMIIFMWAMGAFSSKSEPKKEDKIEDKNENKIENMNENEKR